MPDPPGLGILRSRTGSGANAPALTRACRSSRNPGTPITHTHRYQVTDHGLHTGPFPVWWTHGLDERLIPTGLAHLANQSTPSPLRTAATAYQNAIDNLTDATGLAA